MRGMFTVGVLDCFMEEGIVFDYVIGSSSGVCNAMNYVSGQIGRSKNMMLLPKKESYAGVKELLLHGSFLNLKKLFRVLPYQKKHILILIHILQVPSRMSLWFLTVIRELRNI